MSDDTSTPDEAVPPVEESPSPHAPTPPEVPEAPPAPEAVPAPDAGQVEVPPPTVPAPPSQGTPAAPSYVPPPTPPPYTPPPPPPPPYAPPVELLPHRPAPATESSKILAALSYIFVIIAIVVLFVEPYKDEKFVRFHAIQGISLWVLGIFYWIPFIGWILGIVALVAIIVGAINAFQGRYWQVPVLYDVVKGFIDQ